MRSLVHQKPILLALAFVAFLLAWSVGSPSAARAADTLSVTVGSAAPEQGIPVPIGFSGSSEAVDGDGDGPNLVAVIRPAGGVGCQANYGDDHAAAGGVTHELIGFEEFNEHRVGPGAYSESANYNPPDVGQYLVCAWLEHEGTVEAGPMSATLSATGPKVSQLTVALPAPALPGVAFQVLYTTHTDQKLTLSSVIRRAGGLPCAVDTSLDSQQNQDETHLLGGDFFDDGSEVFGGPVTNAATATEQSAGPYVICTWIEGPDDDEVDAAASTDIYVGTPPPPPPPVVHAVSPRLSLGAVVVSKRRGALIDGTAARSVLGRMKVSVSCGHARVGGAARAAHGHFTERMATPHGCHVGHLARVSASWAGSHEFLRQSVSETVRVKR